ncbi:MAG: dephospho-CoA kinase [Prevotella sp.]|nr:dephospho-CoA kinase [Prevotella sp.]
MTIAITGGIGSGKSFVCNSLAERGIRVYDCDAAAKRLMRTSVRLQQALSLLVGAQLYVDGALQKAVLAQFLLSSEENKQAVNAIVHPVVAEDFLASGYEWFESAILFESRFQQRVHCDYVVCVIAPEETRVQRIMQRDGISREKALEWIRRQMPQEEVARRSDFIVVNDGQADVSEQLDRIFQIIKNKEKK